MRYKKYYCQTCGTEVRTWGPVEAYDFNGKIVHYDLIQWDYSCCALPNPDFEQTGKRRND